MRAPLRRELIISNESNIYKGSARNISKHGLSFFIKNARFNVGQELSFLIELPVYSEFSKRDEKITLALEHIRCFSKVIRLESNGTIAVKFLKISKMDEIKLHRYIKLYKTNLDYLLNSRINIAKSRVEKLQRELIGDSVSLNNNFFLTLEADYQNMEL